MNANILPFSSFDDAIVILNSENRIYPTDNVRKRKHKVCLEKNHFNHHRLKLPDDSCLCPAVPMPQRA